MRPIIAETRARSYAGVTGYTPRLVAAVSRTRERGEVYAQRHGIADVQSIGRLQFAPDNGAFAVVQKIAQLRGRDHEFRVEIEIGLRVDRELRKKIALRHVNAAEPVLRNDHGNSRQRPNFFPIIAGHGKGQ